MGRDQAAVLLSMLDSLLPPKGTRAREQIEAMVAKTIQVTEQRARAAIEGELLRAQQSCQAYKQELRDMQVELEATERNRAELATLLEATIATTKIAAASDARRDRLVSAVVCIQCKARQWLARRRWRTQCKAGLYDPYDVVVSFDSLSSCTEPEAMQIDVLRWAHSTFNIQEADQDGIRIVAHMGLFDKGKTFLINTLYCKNLPSGKLHETTGLSMVYVPDLRFLVIDTKGLQAPVSYKTKGVKQLVDASQTEVFMFELVSRLAHYIIFVVNDYTWPEQRHIVQLHQKYVQSKRENQLIVVHNLRTTRSVHEADELFYKQVASKYEGVIRKELGGLIFTVEEKPRIHHVGFAEYGSPAGNKYNQKNRTHILQLLDQLEGIGERQMSIADKLTRNFAALLPEFVYLESDQGVRRDGSALEVINELDLDGYAESPGIEPDAERDPAVYKSVGSLKFRVPEGHRICMKTEGVFSEFCELVAQDVTFKPPPPNVYEQRLKDRLIRLIEFEIPGVLRKDIMFRKGIKGYSVQMSRKKTEETCDYGISGKFRPPRVATGEFSFDLFFDDGTWELDGGREAVTHENGVLRIRLKQELQARVFKLDDL